MMMSKSIAKLVISSLWTHLALFFVLYLQGASSLKDVRLVSLPDSTAVNGSTVTLRCLYDLEGVDLYMVTWYRGNHQVYRYLPTDKPRTKIFPLAGNISIDIDISQSNSSQLVLSRVNLNVSGKWSCEVTSEAPGFYTASSYLHLNIVVLGKDEPVLWVGEKSRFEAGDILRANCTAAPSKPAANITFYLNQVAVFSNIKGRMRVVERKVSEGAEGLESTWGWLEMELGEFDLRRGFLVLECTTTVAGQHRKTSFRHLKAHAWEPSPQRVRLLASGSCQMRSGIIIYGFLFTIVCRLLFLPDR